jgi:hypothetical protein
LDHPSRHGVGLANVPGTSSCPSTGETSGACPGFRQDHVVPLACGGPDAVPNLQWQTVADAIAKDYRERKA